MRVAILGSRGFPSTYGGFETFVRRLAPYLADCGHDVLVYGREQGRFHRRARNGCVDTVRTLGIDSLRFSTLTFGGTSALDLALRRADAALVVNIALGYFLPILRAAHIPTLLNVDGLEWARAKWGVVARKVFRGGAIAAARYATRLVADSRAVRDVWSSQLGVSPIFIPYGADVFRRRPKDRIESLGLDPGSYVLVVARLVPENNVELTIDAVESMGAAAPALVVVGSAGCRNQLENRLARLAARGQVVWLGHVNDQEFLTDLWHHAGVYVHGHSVGGTNPALLQALGAGAPTLAYPSPFNREVVVDSALIYEPTRRALAERIGLVLGSSELRWRMRGIGVARVRDAYSWSDVCAAYVEQLTQIAGV